MPHLEPDEPDPQFVSDYTRYIVHGPRVYLDLSGLHAWMLMAGLQLLLRHPNLPESIRDTLAQVARLLQRDVSRTPELARIAQAGWDPENDR